LAPPSQLYAEPVSQPAAVWSTPEMGAEVRAPAPVEQMVGGEAPALVGAVGLPVSVGVMSSESVPMPSPSWLKDLEREARVRLEAGQPEVWDTLTRQFEASLIHTALELTRGRRIEAAQKLGIGRNTITRKIQELGIDD